MHAHNRLDRCMKNINGGYYSLYEYLVRENYPLARKIDKKLYPLENTTLIHNRQNSYTQCFDPYNRRYNETPKEYWADQFIGSFQPFVLIANDFQYTFKPYKTSVDALHDAAQPIFGFFNILRGLAILMLSPFLLIKNIYDAIKNIKRHHDSNEFKIDMVSALGWFCSWVIDGLSSLIRGIMQIVFTPLNWMIRMPVRGIITVVNGTPDVSENEDIVRLVALGNDALKEKNNIEMDCITRRLHEEYRLAFFLGQKTKIDEKLEMNLFNAPEMLFKQDPYDSIPMSEDAASTGKKYLGLFSRSIAKASQTIIDVNLNP